jgi:hypothetical protein
MNPLIFPTIGWMVPLRDAKENSFAISIPRTGAAVALQDAHEGSRDPALLSRRSAQTELRAHANHPRPEAANPSQPAVAVRSFTAEPKAPGSLNRPDGWNAWVTFVISPAEQTPSAPPRRMSTK